MTQIITNPASPINQANNKATHPVQVIVAGCTSLVAVTVYSIATTLLLGPLSPFTIVGMIVGGIVLFSTAVHVWNHLNQKQSQASSSMPQTIAPVNPQASSSMPQTIAPVNPQASSSMPQTSALVTSQASSSMPQTSALVTSQASSSMPQPIALVTSQVLYSLLRVVRQLLRIVRQSPQNTPLLIACSPLSLQWIVRGSGFVAPRPLPLIIAPRSVLLSAIENAKTISTQELAEEANQSFNSLILQEKEERLRLKKTQHNHHKKQRRNDLRMPPEIPSEREHFNRIRSSRLAYLSTADRQKAPLTTLASIEASAESSLQLLEKNEADQRNAMLQRMENVFPRKAEVSQRQNIEEEQNSFMCTICKQQEKAMRDLIEFLRTAQLQKYAQDLTADNVRSCLADIQTISKKDAALLAKAIQNFDVPTLKSIFESVTSDDFEELMLQHPDLYTVLIQRFDALYQASDAAHPFISFLTDDQRAALSPLKQEIENRQRKNNQLSNKE